MTTAKNDKEVFTKHDFAKIMQEQRFDHGATQKEFADMLGIKKSYLSMIELGERIPDAIVLRQIADKLDCTADFLLGKEKAESHDDSFVCKRTGLSRDAVKILREGVEHDDEYRLLIDIFGYMIKQYKVYRVRDTATGTGVAKRARIDNDMAEMMDNVVSAIRSLKKPTISNLLEPHKASYGTPDEDPAEMMFQYLKIEEFLWNHGGEVIGSNDAIKYFLREASEAFVNVLLAFFSEKEGQDPDYFINPILPTGRINAKDIDTFQNTGKADSFYYHRAHSALADLMLEPVENDESEEMIGSINKKQDSEK